MAKARCRVASAAREFFPSDGVGVERDRQFCGGCEVRARASSTPSSSASTTACGAAAPSGSAGASPSVVAGCDGCRADHQADRRRRSAAPGLPTAGRRSSRPERAQAVGGA